MINKLDFNFYSTVFIYISVNIAKHTSTSGHSGRVTLWPHAQADMCPDAFRVKSTLGRSSRVFWLFFIRIDGTVLGIKGNTQSTLNQEIMIYFLSKILRR